MSAFSPVLPTNSAEPPIVIASAALASGMIKAGWGRIVNVSSSVVGHPASMIGGDACAPRKLPIAEEHAS
jgi:NAD(P)-dependent dehydrogenase (short-subunit alcohol dehydrogenase family)